MAQLDVFFSPGYLRVVSPFLCGGGSDIVDSLFYASLIVCWGSMFSPCFSMHYCVSFLVLQTT